MNQIKLIRKTLNIKQEDFANKIGIKRTTLSKYETDSIRPSATVLSNICKEYNVNEEWLRNGIGEMFVEPCEESNTELTDFLNNLKINADDSFKKKFIVMLSHLNAEQWQLLADMAQEIINERDKSDE